MGYIYGVHVAVKYSLSSWTLGTPSEQSPYSEPQMMKSPGLVYGCCLHAWTKSGLRSNPPG